VNGFDVRLGCLPREKFEGFLGREKSEGVGSGGALFTPSPEVDPIFRPVTG